MWEAIGAILKSFSPIFARLWTRKLDKQDDPKQKALRAKAEADRIIADGDADAANRFLEQRLRVPGADNPAGQSGNKADH